MNISGAWPAIWPAKMKVASKLVLPVSRVECSFCTCVLIMPR